MFFAKKINPVDLVGEFIFCSDELGISALNSIMVRAGNTEKSQIDYLKSRVDDFKVLWPTSSCVWGAALKTGDAKRFCRFAETEIESRLNGHPFGLEMAREIFSHASGAENKFGMAVTLMLQRSFPEIALNEHVHVISGANFVSSLNYADYIVRNNKIAW